jgi:hypothetical protein
MTSGIEVKGRFKQDFVYLSDKDVYRITTRTSRTGRNCRAPGRMRVATARSSVAAQPGRNARIAGWEHEHLLEAVQKRPGPVRMCRSTLVACPNQNHHKQASKKEARPTPVIPRSVAPDDFVPNQSGDDTEQSTPHHGEPLATQEQNLHPRRSVPPRREIAPTAEINVLIGPRRETTVKPSDSVPSACLCC